MTIRQAGPSDAAVWHEVVEAARRVDDPSHPPVALAGTEAALSAEPFDGKVLRWIRVDGGHAAGAAEVFLPGTANLGWGFATVVVHPEQRRRGHGRALLGAVAAAVAGAGRDTVVLTTDPSTGSSAWASSAGAIKVQELLESSLDVASAAIPELEAPDGYRLEHWVGACPEPLVASFAIAKDAMADAPDGGLGYESTKTTAARVRAAERVRSQRQVDLWVVVAVHEASGEIAGLTELEVDRNCPELAHQEDTAVVPAHRGHGLGLWVKADMLRRLRAAGTPVREIRTTTDFSNRFMLAVNERLGFRPRGVSEQWTLGVG
jgi:GNAT superfamily N-acetyltransferase